MTNEQPDLAYQRAKERVEAMRGFYIHAIVYVVVNLGLFALNMLTSRDALWFYWPLIGWGIGLAINGLVVFAGGLLGREWEERTIASLMAHDRQRPTDRPVR